MTEDELDRILRQFRKEHPPRYDRREKSECDTGMSQLVDCIERQLDAHTDEERDDVTTQCQRCYCRPARVRVLDTHPKAIAEGVESPGIDVCDECYLKYYAKTQPPFDQQHLTNAEGIAKEIAIAG